MHNNSDQSLLISLQYLINIKIFVLVSLNYMLIGTKLVNIFKNETIFDYVIVLSIITVFVSIIPEIFLRLSMHMLISLIVGSLIITLISYWPVIS